MNSLLLWSGRVAGLAGTVLCLVSLGARLAGHFWLGSFQAGTVLQSGIAAMVFACLAFLAWLVEDARRR